VNRIPRLPGVRRRLGSVVVVLASVLVAVPVTHAATPASPKGATASAATPAWVARSNQNAQVLLEVMARFAPEQAGFFGVQGFDEATLDLGPGVFERMRDAGALAVGTLEQRLEREQDPAVRQDLEILIQAARDHQRGEELGRKYDLPYFNVHEAVFQGIRALLDDQVAEKRRPAALVRLRRYAGLEKGATPIAKLAEDRTRERLGDSSLRGPVKNQIEKDLANAARYVDGIGKLFAKYQIAGWEKPYEELKQQLAQYEASISASRRSCTPTRSSRPASTCRSTSCRAAPRWRSARSRTRCR
jgi:hypothetical protein